MSRAPVEITRGALERARVAREVATALALFLSGAFTARLMLFGNVVRTALSRVDRADPENLPGIMSDSVLFGQCVESHMLGIPLPDPVRFSAGVQTILARALDNVERWTPIIRSLTTLLLRDGRLTGDQISKLAENGNTYDGRQSKGRPRG
jgi:hypothetical protein